MKWEKPEIDRDLVKSTAKQYGCNLLIASILVRRTITGSEIDYFLNNSRELLKDPFQLPGMNDAINRIIKAQENGEKVLVFGDRDVDGITATTLVTAFLKQIGIDVSWRLPENDDPYGLSEKAIEEFAQIHGSLIITVDCGISNNREIKRAHDLGIEVIITDHHNPPNTLPNALVIINPKLTDSSYQFKFLAGCGVAYKLVSALRSTFKNKLDCDLIDDGWDFQLAAIGTIADIMPLRNENRIIVREGLKSLAEQPRPGISDLLFKLNLVNKQLDPEKIAWNLAPIINAAGRMGYPERVVSLFLETSATKREELANDIINLNKERKKLEAHILKSIEPQVQTSLDIYNKKFIAIYGEEIKRGFTGIVANRLIKKFNIPALVVSLGKETYIGSIRFPPHYKSYSFREQFIDLFINCGGHDLAMGFNLDKTNWKSFLERLFTYTPPIEAEPKINIETLIIDAELPLNYLTPDIVKLADQFEPYGEMNRPLLFLSKGLKIRGCTFMGKGAAKHIKLTLDTGFYKWPGVYWNAADKINKEFAIDDTVDIVYMLNRNYFKGQVIPQLMIQDLKRSD